MKSLTQKILLIAVIALVSQPLLAQPSITLEGFGGWLWTGSAGYYNNIKVDDLGNYGIRAGVSPGDEMLVEFEWNHTETTLHGNDYITGVKYDEDVKMNYYLLGFNKELSEGPAVPFGLFNVGVLNVKGVESTTYINENFFTIGLGGGLKYYFSDHIGIRLQARLFLPMQFAGVGFGCGGGGCGSSVSGYTNTVQGDFTGGIILKFGGS
jgi:hypothetical protein